MPSHAARQAEKMGHFRTRRMPTARSGQVLGGAVLCLAILALLIFGPVQNAISERGTAPPQSSAPTPVRWSGAPVDNLWRSATFQTHFMT
jgi:hypothetical protein